MCMIRCIVAADEKNGIATDDGIPWNLPNDTKYFREKTSTGIVLMGIGTYKEFTNPMHDHINYVATHSEEEIRPGFTKVTDVPDFFKKHATETINNIGGAGLFASTIQLANELFITQIEADFSCTKFFPTYKNQKLLPKKV
jgi:dihydrofolate reductase